MPRRACVRGGYITPSMYAEIYARDGRKYQYCGTEEADDYQVDHILPAKYGGFAKSFNLVVACRACNMKRMGYGGHKLIPANLDVISNNHPGWRELVLDYARGKFYLQRLTPTRSYNPSPTLIESQLNYLRSMAYR